MKKFLQKIFNILFGNKKVSRKKPPFLSEEVENSLNNVDWSENDVLVGTVRTIEQLYYNLRYNCYFAPEKYIFEYNFPIKYIALYEGDLQRGDGIRYIGEITEISKLKRGEIPVSRNKCNKDELYYFFKVKSWEKLHSSLKLKDTLGGSPVFTNMFLIKNCSFTYQPFVINSPSQFKLMYNIENKIEDIYKVNNSFKISVNEKEIKIIDKNNNETVIYFSDFEERPSVIFTRIKELVYKPQSEKEE